MYHKISMIGRVGRDPENKSAKNGLLFSSFSVAVEIHGKAKNQKVTIWPKITVFDSAGEFCGKGKTCFVLGKQEKVYIQDEELINSILSVSCRRNGDEPDWI